MLTPIKVAIATGLSDPQTCRLSSAQTELLRALDVPEEWKVYRNFPYVDAEGLPAVSLLRASLANGTQFLASHFRRYRERAAPHWRALLDSTNHLLLITGSCGLQLAQAGIEGLQHPARVEMIALGPVTLRSPRGPVTLVQGTRDSISRVFHRSVAQRVAGLAHMGYWDNVEVREIIRQWLSSRISELSVPEAICRDSV